MTLVEVLLQNHCVALLHQLLQYHIISDSVPLAKLLITRVCTRCCILGPSNATNHHPLCIIAQGTQAPELRQVAFDMLRRMNRHDEGVEALLEVGEVRLCWRLQVTDHS